METFEDEIISSVMPKIVKLGKQSNGNEIRLNTQLYNNPTSILYKNKFNVYMLYNWNDKMSKYSYALALHLNNQSDDEYYQLTKWDYKIWGFTLEKNHNLISYRTKKNTYICTFIDDDIVSSFVHNNIDIKEFKNIIQTKYNGVLLKKLTQSIDVVYELNDGSYQFIIDDTLYDDNFNKLFEFPTDKSRLFTRQMSYIQSKN